MIEIKMGNYLVEFYEDNPKYYRFRVKNDPKATTALLSLFKRKKVKKEALVYAIQGIHRAIKCNSPLIDK